VVRRRRIPSQKLALYGAHQWVRVRRKCSFIDGRMATKSKKPAPGEAGFADFHLTAEFQPVGGKFFPLVVPEPPEPPPLVEEPSSKRSMVKVRVPWLMNTSAKNTRPKPGM